MTRFWRNTGRTESRATIAVIGPDGAGDARGRNKGGKRTDFHFTSKRFMVPRGFVIGKVG